ncbi:hypothetical protein R1sor_023395 [Riccia sorocarpa]|uniref:Reverse transcriptase zinc-binding domain-containing protein n=1 Tax=Riccia sorocarpa TaxID=122646 RepID=A0ABD3GRP3_9MARC
MRLITRILDNEDIEWTSMAKALLERDFTNKKVNTGKSKDAKEILVLENIGRITKSKTLDHILHGWKIGKAHMTFDRGNSKLYDSTTIKAVIRLGETSSGRTGKNWTAAKRRLKTTRVKRLGDMNEGSRSWFLTADSWGKNWDTARWANVWKRLRKYKLLPRDKLWIWKILSKGLFTAERGSAMGVMEPSCSRCQAGTENIEHLFRQLQCRFTSSSWNEITALYHQAGGRSLAITSLIELIEDVLKNSEGVEALLFVAHSRATWKDRCLHRFEGNSARTPVKVILQNAETLATSLSANYKSLPAAEYFQNDARKLALMRTLHQRNRLRRPRRDQVGPALGPDTRTASPGMEGTFCPDSADEERRTNRRNAGEGQRSRERNGSTYTPTEDTLSEVFGANSSATSYALGERDLCDDLATLGFVKIFIPCTVHLEGVGETGSWEGPEVVRRPLLARELLRYRVGPCF